MQYGAVIAHVAQTAMRLARYKTPAITHVNISTHVLTDIIMQTILTP